MNTGITACVTCLSENRQLTELRYIMPLLSLINELHSELMNDGGVCWECYSILIKIRKFKDQIRIAQATLRKNGPITQLSSLTSKTNTNYDFVYHYIDPLTTDIEQKPEITLVKEENDISDDGHNYDDDDKKKIVYANQKSHNTNIKHTKKRIKTRYNNRSKLKKIRKREKRSTKVVEKKTVPNDKKFTEVVYTEEEMLRMREEKRNHPNYKKIPYKCDSCVLGFTKKETYDQHIQKKHNEIIGPYACDVCQIRFCNATTAEKHTRRHYKCFRCKLCGHETAEYWTAVNHSNLKHIGDSIDKIHCPQCAVIVKSSDELKNHILKEHRLCCNECGVKFIGLSTLKRHKARIHAIKREFICDICNKTFVSKSRLETHMASHNETIAKRLAYCHTCRVQYKNIYVYRNHLKYSANHTERSYTCTECNKKFASKVYWKSHYEFYHLEKSKFLCDICNKIFISDWRLKNHRQKHHGLKRTRDHVCNDCGKKFYTVSTLKCHKLTHSEQRTYMCEDCGDTFKQRPALYTHAKLVHSGGVRKK